MRTDCSPFVPWLSLTEKEVRAKPTVGLKEARGRKAAWTGEALD